MLRGAEMHLLFAVLEAILVILVTAALKPSWTGEERRKMKLVRRVRSDERKEIRRTTKRHEGISKNRRTKERDRERENNKTNSGAEGREDGNEEERKKRGRGGELEKDRGDRHWRRSNNGLLAMIIEHEAAGTLLKSTENRAGGFTCRINFYLVPSLSRPLLLLLLLLFLVSLSPR